MPKLLRATLAAGLGGTALMTASSTAEMRLRDRPPSTAPVDAVEKLLGRPVPERWRSPVGTAAHIAAGITLGLPRAALARMGVGEPMATLVFLPVASLPDFAIVPAMGVTDPPWRWGAQELVISVVHHVAYAVGASAGLRLTWRV